MKKIGVFIFLAIFLVSGVLATNSTNVKIADGFACLEESAGDCSGLSNQEIALTILATPDKNFDKCVAELESRETSNNWGNVRDTALAVLALNHAGKKTIAEEGWLIDQTKTPTDLVWYIEEDSDGATECHIGYDSSDYIINIGDDKKIDQNAGECLTKSQSNFWLEVSSKCYDREFTIKCDKQFLTTFLYKNKNSPTIYVLEGTTSLPAYSGAKLKINSKCFGDSTCNYEASAWATLALLKTGHDIEEYIPYLIAMADSNKGFLPDAFIYSITSYDSYASKLISSQRLRNYWEADSTAYNRYYDTALAVAMMKDDTEQVKNAKDWLIFSQGGDGCWQEIKETAIVLWALEKRAGKTSGGTTLSCTASNYFCIPTGDCPTNEVVSGFCPATSDGCCMSENLKSCSVYGGRFCSADEICTGNSKKSTDSNGGATCCTGECKIRQIETECEQNDFMCKTSCSSEEETKDYACNSGQKCCGAKETTTTSTPWWIYVLIILIIILAIAIIWFYREKLKLWWFKFRTKYKKEKGGPAMPPARLPPPPYMQRPGFPPIRRIPPPQPPRRAYNPENREMSDVFKKLKDMGDK